MNNIKKGWQMPGRGPRPLRGETAGTGSTAGQILKSQDGVALAIVLLLSVISLAIMSSLVYMLTTGTQISGLQKRYRNALEAGKGGADVTFAMIAARGNPFIAGLKDFNMPAENVGGYDCLIEKLNTGTFLDSGVRSWDAACSDVVTIDTAVASTYDLIFRLGENPEYTVYAKIVNTIEGNSSGDIGLITGGVVASNSGEVSVVSRPYLYAIEIETHNSANSAERSKLSIIYEY